ncbi:MAG: DUF2190 family protein [bacterium]|nr:DUF2190 family protein [bacterium]
MAQYVQTPTKTFTAGGAIAKNLRVAFDGTNIAAAGVGDIEIGTTEAPVLAAGPAAVRLRSAQGTAKMTAAGAIAAGAAVYSAAGGKVNDVASMFRVGIALDAATADGDVIEVLRDTAGKAVATAEDHTAADTLTVAESGSIHTNTGASGAIALTLPAATVGLEFYFQVGAAQALQIDPDGTETIALTSTGVQGAAGKYLVADAVGETVHLICTTAGEWSVFGFTGTWTAEG